MKTCNWKDCYIRIGFEIFYTGEKEEKYARKHLLPHLKKLFDSGMRIKRACMDVKCGRMRTHKQIFGKKIK